MHVAQKDAKKVCQKRCCHTTLGFAWGLKKLQCKYTPTPRALPDFPTLYFSSWNYVVILANSDM